MTTIMASAVSIYIYSCPSSSSSSISRPSSLCSLSTCVKSNPSTQISCFPKWNPQLGFSPFSSWTGLRHLGSSIPQRPSRNERKRHCKSKGVHASLFGVGAPEALVIGVVALLVFGPKGLAEVARNLGKTLRAFQPTIRELQDVSREFKSTLEREIGLDEIQNSKQNTYSSNITRTPTTTPSVSHPEDANIGVDTNSAPSSNRAYSSEDYLKITEEQLKASAAKQQAQNPSLGENQLGQQTQPQDAEAGAAAAAVAVPQQQKQGESET